MALTLYPLRFAPVYKDYVWGGDRIIRAFGRKAPPGIYAESWEISARREGMSRIANGPLAGTSLAELVDEYPREMLGSAVPEDTFPLLIKLIDSRERLSVQVHPGDETAARFGGDAKTEMWYVLDAGAGAGVFAGLKTGTTRKTFREAVHSGAFEPLLNRLDVQPGDAVFMPGGRVHAIDAGCLLLEVQQNSNTTYRIHDWGRVGKDGRPRPTHVEQAMRVILWDDREDPRLHPRTTHEDPSLTVSEIALCSHFRVERIALGQAWTLPGRGESFQVLFIARGPVRLAWDGGEETVAAGTSVLVPAALRGAGIAPAEGTADALRITVP